jgi:hypothetical protein
LVQAENARLRARLSHLRIATSTSAPSGSATTAPAPSRTLASAPTTEEPDSVGLDFVYLKKIRHEIKQAKIALLTKQFELALLKGDQVVLSPELSSEREKLIEVSAKLGLFRAVDASLESMQSGLASEKDAIVKQAALLKRDLERKRPEDGTDVEGVAGADDQAEQNAVGLVDVSIQQEDVDQADEDMPGEGEDHDAKAGIVERTLEDIRGWMGWAAEQVSPRESEGLAHARC